MSDRARGVILRLGLFANGARQAPSIRSSKFWTMILTCQKNERVCTRTRNKKKGGISMNC